MATITYIYIANPTGCTSGDPCPEYDNSPEYINAWIDWNDDKVFANNEKIVDAALTGYLNINYQGTMSTSTIVTIPPDAASSPMMRTNLGWGHDPNNPCERYWTWGDVDDRQIQITPIELRITQLDALDDFGIANISDPIWVETAPAQYKPVADGSRDGFLFITYPGSFKIKATVESSPQKPSWTPRVEYSWTIPGTGKSGSGTLSLMDIPTGWAGEFAVQMPDRVGKYNLDLKFSLYDSNGSKINTKTMSHVLYAGYKNSILPAPKEVWLDRATNWANGAASPSDVASQINTAIYNTGWLYGYPPSIIGPFYRCEDYQFGGWPDLIENSAVICGDCVRFSNVWAGLVQTLGVTGMITQELGTQGLGFVTRLNSIAPDGLSGNAHPQGQAIDRWYFTMHQLGQLGRWLWSTYYDPTFGAEYTNKRAFIEWDNLTDFVNVNGELWSDLTGGHKIKRNPVPGTYGWGDFEYHSPSEPVNTAPNYGAAFTGVQTAYGLDSDADGIYNAVGVDVEVNVAQSGNYSVVGSLKSGSGEEITSRSGNNSTIPLGYGISTPEAGIHPVKLTFSGEDIYRRQIDGAYAVELMILDENGFIIDTKTFNTPYYSYTAFGEMPARMKVAGDHGKDTDGDGLYDYLSVDMDIKVLQAMKYRIHGVLYAQDGRRIDSVNISQYLANPQMIELQFEGAELRKSDADGAYLLAVSLHNENGTQIGYEEYQTFAYSSADFQPPSQKFSGNYSDKGVDTDGDNLLNALAVSVGVEITASGDYTVEGWLFDENGQQIETAAVSGPLSEGAQTVTLNFNGLSINRHQVNGPYHLKYLSIKGEKGIIDFMEEAYTTSAYKYTVFQGPKIPLVALTGNYTDYGKDTNKDGILDYLTVDVGVNLAKPGYVITKARLVDGNGDEIVWAENTSSYLGAGPQIVHLNFNGKAIYNYGVDGPYHLQDVYIYHTGDPMQADYIKEAYTTGMYAYRVFGEKVINHPPVANAGPDQTLECTKPGGTSATLDGSASSDPDDNPLTYAWTGVFGTASGVSPVVFLPTGNSVITLVVNDGQVTSQPDMVNIAVEDATPPGISLGCSPAVLWPPNHKMVEIIPTITASDACDASVNIELHQIIMNEGEETNAYDPDFDEGLGDGNTVDDIQVTDGRIYLRAERSGNNLAGRKYTITYRAVDADGNSAMASCNVLVPHDMR